MVKQLWRFFRTFLGAPVAGVQLCDRPAGQGIAPITRNLCRRAEDKAAFAHHRMGDGEGGRAAGKGTAAPQYDIQIEHPARPGLAAAAPEFRFDALEQRQQGRRRQWRFDDRNGIGIAALGWSDRARGDDAGGLDDGQALPGQPLPCCGKDVARRTKALVALVRAQGDQVEHMRQSGSCAMREGREWNKWFQAGGSAAIM